MASSYDYPEDYIAWYIIGDKLAIVTTNGSDTDSTHAKLGDWKSIDESVTNGINVHYQAEPDKATTVTDTPDIDNTLHIGLVDYVKYRLYLDKAGTVKDPNQSMLYMSIASKFEKKWNETIKRYGMRKRDKVGGSRRIMPPDLR